MHAVKRIRYGILAGNLFGEVVAALRSEAPGEPDPLRRLVQAVMAQWDAGHLPPELDAPILAYQRADRRGAAERYADALAAELRREYPRAVVVVTCDHDASGAAPAPIVEIDDDAAGEVQASDVERDIEATAARVWESRDWTAVDRRGSTVTLTSEEWGAVACALASEVERWRGSVAHWERLGRVDYAREARAELVVYEQALARCYPREGA